MIDYEDLLRRYILHVGLEEGSDFISYIGRGFAKVRFTPADEAALKRLASEGRDCAPSLTA